MGYAIALHSIVPVRAEAHEQAEQTTQLLFGELCTIEEQHSRWIRIHSLLDGQTGWVDSKMITPMTDEEYTAHTEALKTAAWVAFPVAYAVSGNNGQTLPLTAGTRLPKYKADKGEGTFNVLGVDFRITPNFVIEQAYTLTAETLLNATRFFLNIPYLWGGKNGLGMDCSGFTQIIFTLFGKHLPRNAAEQATQGTAIADLAAAQAGDLVFFCPAEGATETPHMTHVGILLDKERVIHCSGRVKVEKIDAQGILSFDYADSADLNGKYTHKLLAIRRV